MALTDLTTVKILRRLPEDAGRTDINRFQRAEDARGVWWFRAVRPRRCQLCDTDVERGWQPRHGAVTSLDFICDAHFDAGVTGEES